MRGKRVLVIDDDPRLLKLVELIFSQAKAQVYTASNGQEGLSQFYAHQPDLVILDLMLPKMDGWEICHRIRQVSQVPLIMLTGLGQDDTIIRGLVNYGADDYITKPFSSDVLLARAQAVLRRTALPATAAKPVTYGDNYLTIASTERRVFVRGKPVKLSNTEYRLLIYLVQNAGHVLTFRQILNNVWGGLRDNNEYVHAYMWYLRQKLEEDPHHPLYFLTEYGVGYRFEKQILG